jgi:protocatechuate 3,4-dioxygenase beta subunit
MLNRRNALRFGFGSLVLAACSGRAGSAPRDAIAPTPHIDDDDALPPVPETCAAIATADNIEGPFYKRGAPNRSVLVAPGDDGERLALGGVVMSTTCAPIGGAVLDIWQANAKGDYDLEGFRYRGAMTTNAQGRWQLRTIVPGRYLNGRRYRPAHLHVKLRAPGFQPLTTQLYFDGDPYNEGDDFIVPSLIMATRKDKDVRLASFDFALVPA